MPEPELLETFEATGTGPLGNIQQWTVPDTGEYLLEAVGAQGGVGERSGIGGLGARVSGEFDLNQGDVLNIIVGHVGPADSNSVGGGGASAIWKDGEIEPLLVAGGGGGFGVGTSTNQQDQAHAHLETWGKDGFGSAGAGDGGTNGGPGGPGGSRAAGGAGWSGDQDQLGNAEALLNGGKGDEGSHSDGGFGSGGGNHQSTGWGSTGGGGGYSGGGGGYSGSSDEEGAGGGGGSFNAATVQDNEVEAGTGDGVVKVYSLIQGQPNVELDAVANISLELEGFTEHPFVSLEATSTLVFDNPVSTNPFVSLDATSVISVDPPLFFIDTFGWADIEYVVSASSEVDTTPTETPEHLHVKPTERVSPIMPVPKSFDEYGRPTE